MHGVMALRYPNIAMGCVVLGKHFVWTSLDIIHTCFYTLLRVLSVGLLIFVSQHHMGVVVDR